jgi:hypothetical protein
MKKLALLGFLAAPSAIFAAEPWDTVTTTLAGLNTSVSAAVVALIGIVAIFIGVKLAKRVLNKA